MPQTRSYILFCLVISLQLFLAACSPVNKSDNYAATEAGIYGGEEYDQEENVQFVPVESEQDLEEELAALEKTGAWTVDDWEHSVSVEGNTCTDDPVSEEIARKAVYDFPVTMNKQVEFYLNQFQNKQRKMFKRWLERSGRYMPVISKELEKADLPQELAYLAMIESGYNPSAYSHAHAAGLWQFIRGTGRNYGLRIDSWVDERRDPAKATKAAVSYLSDLYERFGDWQLAVAAYNAGEGKIERGLKKYKATNFWELAGHKYLHLETKRYVPKLIAAIIIASDPEQYGFTDLVYKKPVDYELVEVRPRMDLAAVAVSGSVSVKKLRKLNNELRRNQTPPAKGSYTLKVPAGSKDRIAANLPRTHAIVTTKFKTHKVRKNDTLRQVSKKYHISMTTLLKANKLSSSKLKVGQHLRIPYRSNKYVLLKKGQSAKDFYAANSGRLIMHELARGETLSKVAKQYNVPVEMLIQWNDIKNVRRIRAGHQLAIYMGNDSGTSSLQVASTTTSASRNVVVLADSKKRKPEAMGSVKQLIALQEQKNQPVESAATTAEPGSIITLADSKKQRPGELVLASLEKTTTPVEMNYKSSVLTEIISLSDHKKRRPTTHNTDTPVTAVSYYKVRSGDSLWSIARKLKVSTLDLKRWNGLRSDKLQPGTRLVIKKG